MVDFGCSMTTQEIQDHISNSIGSKYNGVTSESGEIMTSEGGDGRFMGKVDAVRYDGLPIANGIFLAIGETDKAIQIVRLGSSECLNPTPVDLNAMLLKELAIEVPDEESDA